MSSSVESVVSRSGENPSSEISEMAPFETAQSSSWVLSSLYLFRERSNWTDFLFLDMVCGCGEGNLVVCVRFVGAGSKRLYSCCKRCIRFFHNDAILICE